jgi:exonuclease VII large subunit
MQRLDDRSDRLVRAMNTYLTVTTHRVQNQVLKHPAASLALHMQNFAHISDRFNRSAQALITSKQQELMYLTGRLEQSSYSKILEKGFSWTSVNNSVVTKAADFPDDAASVTLHFVDGNVVIKPKEIVKQSNVPAD